MARKGRSVDWQSWGIVGGILVLASIPVWMGVGKYQLCKYYFPEMNRVACFFTQLPAVMPRGRQ